MARKHYWQFLVTDEGNPIENAQISIYTAGTEDPVWVYLDEIGSEVVNTAPQVVTSRKGYFEFWIGDRNESETYGYPLSTKFKVAWSATGVSSGYIDYIDVFSTSVEPVDETDVNKLRNKAVSNFLAKGWQDHKNKSLPSDTPHGIGFIDEANNDVISGGANIRNKVISDYQGFLWDTHVRTLYDGTTETIASGDSASVAHGIERASEYTGSGTGYFGQSGDTELNKLISNDLIYQSDSHINNTLLDDHKQYSLVSGDRGYSSAVGYDGAVTYASLTTNDFVTKGMIEGKTHKETILGVDWFDNGDNTYEYEITHNIGEGQPIVIVWDTSTSPNVVIQPLNIERVDDNTTKVVVTNNVNHIVRIFA